MDLFGLFKKTSQYLSQKSKEAGEWFKDKVSEPTRQTSAYKEGSLPPTIGKLYLFEYPDPKYKDVLPYWDLFPLVIPLEPPRIVATQAYNGEAPSPSFLGLNLHYLNYRERAQLLTALRQIETTDRHSDAARLNISYRLLNQAASKYPQFQVCVKRYMINRVANIQEVVYTEWEHVVMLPLQRWSINTNSSRRGSPPY